MNSYCLASLVLFSLWDYYIPFLGGRVFDYIGIVLIVVYVAARFMQLDFDTLKFTRAYILLLMVMFPSVVFAYLDGGWLTASAFLVGSLVVYGFYFSSGYNVGKLHKQMSWLIGINLMLFFIQYFAHKFFGIVVDYHSFVGTLSPRTFNVATGYFRAAGLFEEPNSFCLTLFMLNVLRVLLTNKKLDMLLLISLLALVLSESLWGMGAMLTLAFLATSLSRSMVSNLVLLAGLGGLSSLGFVILTNWPDIAELVLNPITVRRFANLDSDASAAGRYGGGAVDLEFNAPFLFGHGLTTSDFQLFSGANAIGFYIYSFGLLGLLTFLAWIMIDSKKNRLWMVIAILFVMTSYPLFTYAFWWAWLAILIRTGKSIREVGQPSSDRDTFAGYAVPPFTLISRWKRP